MGPLGSGGGREPADSRFSLPRERNMTHPHALLWTTIIVTTVADVLLTMTGMASGLQEGNAVMRLMIGAFGPAGIWIVKFAAMIWLVAGWSLLSDRDATIFLALFAFVTVAVTVHNSLLLLAIVAMAVGV